MNTYVSPEDFQHALAVAKVLQQDLLDRVRGCRVPAWRCSCGACSGGPSAVTGLRIPTEYPYQIAMWSLWSCDKTGDDGAPEGLESLSRFISWAELFPLFRNRFAGIPVRVDHPYAQLLYDGGGTGGAEHTFVQSGRYVTVHSGNGVQVRPTGELGSAVWVNAELRLDTNMVKYANEQPLVACNLDAWSFGQPSGAGAGSYYNVGDVGMLPTFYTRIPRFREEKERLLPVARIVALDTVAQAVTFELDQSVEVFQP